jgi:hypothetical protein
MAARKRWAGRLPVNSGSSGACSHSVRSITASKRWGMEVGLHSLRRIPSARRKDSSVGTRGVAAAHSTYSWCCFGGCSFDCSC